MKLISIENKKYKILKNNLFKFNSTYIFPKGWQIIGLIWSNGSWKTTFCSVIAWVFQSIFTRSTLDFNTKIKFEYNKNIQTIECKDSYIKLYINDKIYYEFKLGTKLNKEQKQTHNNKICKFWGWKIILSTFETNAEYPNKKPFNYIWNDPIIKYDIGLLYWKNSYWYPSITNGIIRFMKNSDKQNIANIFLEQMWFQLSRKIYLKIVSNIIDYKPYLTNEDNFWLYDPSFKKSRHYTEKKVIEAKRKLNEVTLYNKIINDKRLKLTSDSQSLDFVTMLNVIEDYNEYMWKYIFLNWIGLIKDGIEYWFEDLSSWEKFLILRYISILSWIEKESIIIVEEPENHLNPKWRELVIPALHKATSEFNSILIFTTHDHRIIRYLHNDCVLKIQKWSVKRIKEPILLCDEFDFESLWEKTIPFIYQDLKKTYYNMNIDEKAKLLNSMCNVEEKILLKKLFLKELWEK